MTIKKKILIGYGVAFALMSLVVVWAIANLVSLGKATEAILSENYRSILAAENMVDALERQDSGVLLILLGLRDEGANQFRENEAQFLEWLARAKDNVTIEGEKELVTAIDSDYAQYRQLFDEYLSRPDTIAALRTAPITDYQESIQPLFEKVRDACIELRNLNEETMYSASVSAETVANRAIWSTALVSGSALIVALIFSLILAERIVRPIHSFMEASRHISEGDYSITVSVDSGDELGRLAKEFNQMTSQLGRYHRMNIDQIVSEKNKGQAILSSIEDALIVFDTELQITALNHSARRLLNLEFSETSAVHCDDVIPGSEVRDLIRTVVESGEPPHLPDEQRILTFADGDKSRHYLFSITPVRGSDHYLSGIVLLLKDVTRLKEVDRLKSEFVMAASHELRTPLTSLGMSIDLLLENVSSKLSEKDSELLQAAHEEVHRMKALVNDLLDLSKIEAGRILMEFDTTSVIPLCRHVMEVFDSQLSMKDIKLILDVPADIPSVRADANKITWVLTNLVSNAIRYVERNGYIELKAQRIGSHVHLSVTDDGPGIPPEYQSKIFEKFVQVEGQEPGGTGLGLAICKEIARAHSGTIWVESNPGQGSRFVFTLPAVL